MNKETKPEVMADMIEYQDNSVVSRTIIGQKTGTVTLFAFDKGQELSEHTAPFDALVFLIEGEAEITISGKQHGVHSGQLLLMPAHEPHAVSAKEKFKMLLTMIRS